MGAACDAQEILDRPATPARLVGMPTPEAPWTWAGTARPAKASQQRAFGACNASARVQTGLFGREVVAAKRKTGAKRADEASAKQPRLEETWRAQPRA